MKTNRLILKCAKIICAVFMLPVIFNVSNVYAAATEVSDQDTLVGYFTSGGEIKLTADITVTANKTLSAALDIDLNGHTLNLGKTTLTISADLTVRDTSANQEGKISGAKTTNYYFFRINSPAVVTLESGSLISEFWGINNHGTIVVNGGLIQGKNLAIANCGEVIINDGTVTGENGMVIKNNEAGSSVVMNGGLVQTLSTDDVAINNGAANSTVTINGGAIEAKLCESETRGSNAIAGFKDTITTINGGTLTACANALLGNGSGSESGNNDGSNAIFNINGGTITSTISAGIYAPQLNGQTTITGGTIKGRTGIEIRAGVLNISGGTIISEGDYNVKAETNGLTTFGAAVSAAQHTSKREITINITGGDFTANTPISDANPLGYDDTEHSKVHINVSGGKFAGTNNDGVYDNIVNGYKKYDKSGYFLVVPEDYEEDEDILVPDTGNTTSEKSGAGFDAFTQIATISTLLLLCLRPVVRRAYRSVRR